mgnify:FL=1|tara:strand:+ start:581 stop:1000 length:420 start_codon:yes stop_codon:yes gene_type:complete
MAYPAYPSSQSFPLTFPANPKFKRFQIREIWTTPSTESPFTGDIQVFKFTGSNRLEWEAEIPPMQVGDANIDVWIRFLMELQGQFGTFTLNIQNHTTIDYVRGYTSGLPSVWRSRDSFQEWEFTPQKVMAGLTIKAREA